MSDQDTTTTEAKASLTARAVAAGRAVGYRHLHDPLAARFLRPVERHAAVASRRIAALPGGADMMALATGGLSLHAAARMAAIDAEVVRFLADGCQQVVIVGAGFDTRAWRMAGLAGLAVWEVDLPATQTAKQEGLRGLRTQALVQFVPADLSRVSLADALTGASHDLTRPTAWVWEAVAPYLPPDAVTATLQGIRRSSAPGSRLAMTFAHPALGGGVWADTLGGRVASSLVDPLGHLAFRLLGEPILSAYDEWRISSLLTDHGFSDPVITTHRSWLQAAGLPHRPDPAAAEMLVTARI